MTGQKKIKFRVIHAGGNAFAAVPEVAEDSSALTNLEWAILREVWANGVRATARSLEFVLKITEGAARGRVQRIVAKARSLGVPEEPLRTSADYNIVRTCDCGARFAAKADPLKELEEHQRDCQVFRIARSKRLLAELTQRLRKALGAKTTPPGYPFA